MSRASRGGTTIVVTVRTVLAVHEEGNRLSESKCEGNLAKLGNWIFKTHGLEDTMRMLATLESREKAATDMLGRYYSGSPVFKELVDAVAGEGAVDQTRESAIREALQCIERNGRNGIQVAGSGLAETYAEEMMFA